MDDVAGCRLIFKTLEELDAFRNSFLGARFNHERRNAVDKYDYIKSPRDTGFGPIRFGIIIVMTVELGLIHPPVGMNVFVIKSVVKDVSFTTIFKGVLPFVATDIVRLVILIAFPIIALYLPGRMD